MRISSFREGYFFLSNFYTCNVTVRVEGIDLTFKNSESAFQAFKCPERAKEFLELTGKESKRLGHKVKLRSDWDDLKVIIMKGVCRAKFAQNPELMEQLLATGDAELVEGNTWGDTYWGVCKGKGQNYLGRILMTIREEEKAVRSEQLI